MSTDNGNTVEGILDRIVSQESGQEGGYAEFALDDKSVLYGNPLHNKSELKQALNKHYGEMMLELVGEDAKPSIDIYTVVVYNDRDKYQNKLREELRANIKEALL